MLIYFTAPEGELGAQSLSVRYIYIYREREVERQALNSAHIIQISLGSFFFFF